MKKINNILFLVGAAMLLLVPMLNTNIKPDQVSEIDNRQLQEFPSLQVSGFRSGLEGYVSDRIGFRSEAITIYQKFCDAAFHKLVHPSYIYGKGKYIMAPWDLTTYQHLDVSEEYIENFTDYLQSLKQFCQDQDMEFLFFLAPNKETIYPEYFPDGYNIKDQPNRSDRIIEKMEEKGVPYLFPKEMFLTLKQDEQLYNVKYDAGHWNSTGAFYGHQQIIHYLNEKFPEMGELKQEEFEITQVRVETLLVSHFEIDEMVPAYAPIDTNAVKDTEIFEQVVITSPNQYYLCYKNEIAAQNGAPKVLIFGDSYFHSSVSSVPIFYPDHCAEVVALHAENMPNAEYYISVFQPDIVIYEVVERQLQSSWDTYKSTKRYYNLSKLLQGNSEEGAPIVEPISLDVDLAALQAQAVEQEIVSFSGNLDQQVDSLGVCTLVAILNGKEYYPVFDQNTLAYSFAFRGEDIKKSTAISAFLLREAEI